MKLLDKKYSPSELEDRWYKHWLEKDYFSSQPSDNHYTIVIPPPNVTGKLTMGHVLNNTIQDDHASIATESKVAKMLQEKGIDKKDISREEFLEHAWEWKEKYGGIIINQLQKLGCSCDWNKLNFTMDDKYSEAVLESFVRLFDKGLIYKGNRLVNWCPKSQTALSDEEVIFKEVNGKLWYIKYAIENSDSFIEIATTRPETMLGDVAVAVNPSDKRFKDLIGNNAILPIVGRKIPIKDNCLLKEEDYMHKVGFSERGGVPIEYYLSDQWFLKMKELAKPAIKSVKKGEINFYPNHWVKTYDHWMDNIQDWCISRQLYWGHRIPVWYKKDSDHSKKENWFISTTPPKDIDNWEQDTDVLDTWFSSWLWPFAVHNWPEKEKTHYYPTSALVTGPDIIFFWVARMIMSGFEFMGEAPFKDVYFTSILRDEQGRKFSKSLGNSPDPIGLFDKYGTDATRFSVMLMSPQGSDVYFSESGLEIGRNFMSKIWNASRFIMLNHDKNFNDSINKDKLTFHDEWILSELDKTIKKVNAYYDSYQFNEAIKVIYEFTWSEFCDWYIELAKINFQSDDQTIRNNTYILSRDVLKKILLLLHPVSPFITEEIWSYLKSKSDDDIIISAWPQLSEESIVEDSEMMSTLKEIVTSVRTIRSELNILPSKKIDVLISVNNATDKKLFENLKDTITSLSKIDNLEIDLNIKKPKKSAVGICKKCVAYVPLGDLVDTDSEIQRLTKRLNEVKDFINTIEKKLKNKSFIDKAPENIVNNEKNKLNDFIVERDKIIDNIAMLK